MAAQSPSPLLAVLLVASSSRGSNLVFSWPKRPHLFKRYSRVRYYTDKRGRANGPMNNTAQDRADAAGLNAQASEAEEDPWDEQEEDEESAGDGSDSLSSSALESSEDSSASEDDVSVAGRARNSRTGAPPGARSLSRSRKIERSQSNPLSEISDSEPSRAADDTNGRDGRAAKAYKTYLSYDVNFLASILSPRQDLCHQKFELVVDDLAFVGHPVCVDPCGRWEPEPEDGRRFPRSNAASREDDSDTAGEYADSSIRGRASEAAPSRAGPGNGPTSNKDRSRSRPPISTSTSSTPGFAPLTLFHLVLVLDRPDPSPALPSLDLTTWLQFFYDNIAFKMTAALFAEQVRMGYVGKETEKLLALRERCMDDGQSYSAFVTQCLAASSLARSIRDVHQSISTSSDAFVTINDSIDAHLQLPPLLHDPGRMLKVPDLETELDTSDPVFLGGGGFAGLGAGNAGTDSGYARIQGLKAEDLAFEEWTRTTGPVLLPWKTLLILNDNPGGTRRNIFGGGGSLAGDETDEEADYEGAQGIETWARKFTTLLKPTLSGVPTFADLADLLDWDLHEDVYPMVRHLIYYREARVIDVPRLQNIYAISPLFEFQSLPQLSTSFALSFPTLPPLTSFLSKLSSCPQPFSTLVPHRYQRVVYLDVLIWLLRHEAVVQLHVRVRLIASEEVKRRAAALRDEARERRRHQREQRRVRGHKATPDAGRAGEEQRGRSRERSRSSEPMPISGRRGGSRSTQDRRGGSGLSEGLSFERRPVLRSLSPSRLGPASMSRPSTPRGRQHLLREGNSSNSSTESPGQPTPRTSRLCRSPSQARLRIRGFGDSEEVVIDGETPLEAPPSPSGDEARRLSLVGEDVEQEESGDTSAEPRLALTGSLGGLQLFEHHAMRTEPSSFKPGEGKALESIRGKISSMMPGAERDPDGYVEDEGDDDEDEEGNDDEDEDEDEAEDDEGHDERAVEVLRDFTPSLIPEPSRASREENEWIGAMMESRETWLAQRFLKLLPYLNGKHTVDEMIYREEMRRRDMRQLLSAFKDDIITFLHP